MYKSLVAGIALLGLGTLAVAADSDAGSQPGSRQPNGQRMTVEARFKAMDANGDGKISMEEFAAARMGGATGSGQGSQQNGASQRGERRGGQGVDREARFKAMDTNHDGSLSLDEVKAAMAKFGGGQRRRGG